MHQIQQGNSAAFESLYKDLGGLVMGVACGMVKDRALAQDLTQKTFLNVFRARGAWMAGAPVTPWVLTIARNVALDALRHRAGQRVQLTAQGVLPDPPAPPPNTDALEHARELLVQGMAALPEQQREALVLLRVEGLSTRDAAAVAGVSEGALRVRLHRAVESLRGYMVGRRAHDQL